MKRPFVPPETLEALRKAHKVVRRELGADDAAELDDLTAQPKAPAVTPSGPAPEYRTELMELQRRAIAHFHIGPKHWPKQHELEKFFLSQRLPGGVQISNHLARAMATICRPLAAQKGGNKPIKSGKG